MSAINLSKVEINNSNDNQNINKTNNENSYHCSSGFTKNNKNNNSIIELVIKA